MNDKTKKLRSYGFSVETEKFADAPSVVVRVLVREGECEHPINPRSDGEDSIWDAPKKTDGLALDSLRLRIWLNHKRDGCLGPNIHFEHPSFVDTRKAERMLRTMRRIDAVMNKAQAREPGDVLMALAKAIGATWYVEQVGQSRGPMMDNCDWRFCDVERARDALRDQIEAMLKAEAGGRAA